MKRANGETVRTIDQRIWDRWLFRTLLEVACFAVILFALLNALLQMWDDRYYPPLGTDGLIYHLTLPALWLQRGYLCEVDLPFHDSAAEHSPHFSHTILYWLMRWTGDDGLTWLVQPVFFCVTYGLFYRSVRLLGAKPRLSLLAATLLLCHPPFLGNMLVVNNDLVLTCGTAALLYGMLVITHRTECGAYIAVAGLTLMLATKEIGLIYTAAGLPILVALLVWKTRHSGQPIRWGSLLLVSGGMLVAGSVFYLRNLALYRNPFYPANVSFFGLPLLQGLYDPGLLIDHGWSLRMIGPMLLGSKDSFAIYAPVGIVLWAGWCLSAVFSIQCRKSRRAAARLAVCLFFPAMAVVLYFWLTPFWREHRLLFPVHYELCLGFANGIIFLARIGRRLGTRPAAELALVLFTGTLTMVVWRLPLALVPAVLLLSALLAQKPAFLRLALPWIGPGVAAVALALVVSGPWWYPAYAAHRAAFRSSAYSVLYGSEGDVWALVESITAAAGGKTIAYSGTARVFPLFGSRLQNRIWYVALSPDDRPQAVQLRPGVTLPSCLAQARRRRVDEAYWLQGLRTRRVDILFLCNTPEGGGTQQELAIVKNHPELFRPLGSGADLSVFQVLR